MASASLSACSFASRSTVTRFSAWVARTACQMLAANPSSSAAVTNPAAVKAESSFLTQNQPGLFQPNPDFVAVWTNTLSGPPASFANMTQYYLTPEFWYFTK